MQSRTTFFATGLVPVTNPSSLPSEGCSICTEPFTNPIALPCAHIFCKQCILDWLSLPARNTCPFCRLECFPKTYIPQLPTAELAMAARRTALIHRAASRLRTGNLLEIFSEDISWDTSSLDRATFSATTWLITTAPPPTTTTGILGPAYISKRHLGSALLTMANLLKTYANLSGRGYSAQEAWEWRIIIDLLYHAIEIRHGGTEDALILTWVLGSEVRFGMMRVLSEDGTTSRFLVEQTERTLESPAGDLYRLINFLAFGAFEEAGRRRRLREAVRDEPRLVVRVGMRVRNVFIRG